MAVRGKAAITDATGATLFGPQNGDPYMLINRGPNRPYITGNGDTAVDDIGFNMEVNEAVASEYLPGEFRKGNLKAVCAAGETASLYWFTK